jgi:hypothetical protein
MSKHSRCEAFPLWVVVIDYVLGMIMWTLIGRFGMSIFLPENSSILLHAVLRARDESAAEAVRADHARRS